MNNIKENLGKLYHPQSALVFYQTKGSAKDTYVEYFDMDRNGAPINAHPLTVREASQLAKALKMAKQEKEPTLKPTGIISNNMLHLDAIKGKAIWFTKGMKREMFFSQSLEIPKGIANVPPLLWVANRQSLYVFALKTDRRPTEKTKLYNAPFFNVYENGNVCMGNVDIRIKKTASLEEFTKAWEDYFFNSYFSHLMNSYNPIKGNCVMLWEELINNRGAFPKEVLKKNKVTLTELM
ncbi:PRTRC system protein B [Sphingobacterium siyangense]|uniref:PRTRC genetic system protein B n=1 Tax=Sphingobacterium siyangense TaxID=459529 RepID=A0A562MK46_9SPHI|nr:PRTRC system protein B [Sphingobacterium siyangense]TWI20307.1 PRTRC genetic system protein B [Sphingobacterium siyangense]